MKTLRLAGILLSILFVAMPLIKNVRAGDPQQTAAAWVGTYRGTLPCSDCQGVETELTLNPNQTYKLISRKLGKKGPAFVMGGKISWNKAGTMVTLDGMKDLSQPYVYSLNGLSLTQMDVNGSPYPGETAAKYVLQKGEPSVQEKYWKLISLYGITVEKEKTWRKDPHIMLLADENRLNGSSHCNIISGNYALSEGGGIKFSEIVLTKTACEVMDLEVNLTKVLEIVDGYTISGDTLKLHKAKMVPSAIFVAVYGK